MAVGMSDRFYQLDSGAGRKDPIHRNVLNQTEQRSGYNAQENKNATACRRYKTHTETDEEIYQEESAGGLTLKRMKRYIRQRGMPKSSMPLTGRDRGENGRRVIEKVEPVPQCAFTNGSLRPLILYNKRSRYEYDRAIKITSKASHIK
ncbi:hypothetical protein KSP39_PZI016480 [Platanthera zijinensis]|uniref:Uncharacterized protein n=1 Tax=Platanthera zijinensis TaxID=2320716 RepID=A0AAP0B872_9ASPA